MGLFGGGRRSKNSKNKPSKKKTPDSTVTCNEGRETSKNTTKKPKVKGAPEQAEQSSTTASAQRQRKTKSKSSDKGRGSAEQRRATANKKLAEMTSPDKKPTPPGAKNATITTISDDDPCPTLQTCTMAPIMAPSKEVLTASKEPIAASREAMSSLAPSREALSSKAPPESLKTHTQPTQSVTSLTEKWVAEGTAKAWMEKADFTKTKSEYEQLQKMPINVEKDCKKWKANPKLNQSEDYPALDATLFKCTGEIFKPNCDKEYVNISHVEVPLKRAVNIGQMPVKGSEETFWKAFFELHVTFMTILNEDAASIDFFPQRANDYVHYGAMFVNNRRVETVSEDVVRFVIEVLPSGCSNSHIATITVVKNWLMDSVHAKHAVVMKEILEMSTWMASAPAEENAMIMSKHGAGRAGYFVALAVAVAKMDQKQEPNILEIVKAIRVQRLKAVETVTQYASLYMAMFYYIKRKVQKSGEIGGEKKPSSTNANSDPGDPLCKKSMQLTQLFTSALMTEIAANAGRSTMTMIQK